MRDSSFHSICVHLCLSVFICGSIGMCCGRARLIVDTLRGAHEPAAGRLCHLIWYCYGFALGY